MRLINRLAVALLTLTLSVVAPLQAAPSLAERAHGIAMELRDPASTNLTLAESETQIAYELKARIAQMLAEGQSKTQIVDSLAERYGQQIRYQPPFNAATAVLWLTPVVLLLLLLSGMWWRHRSVKRNS
ncbi:cytochrome c-type biogenesis protein [Ferrimonas senticii]|uniref:cytochrome c-type biogenesis protein n=1 Tax=Ferrimonas senticii TaxID=394566 RepID=UPI0003F9DC36|nr:cytochrome c-type biogenesis protein CcmH [Ferrimonas senticii]